MKKLLFLVSLIALTLTQYNPQLSKDLCHLTITSYCLPKNLIDWSCGPCKSSMLQIKNVSIFINTSKSSAGYIAVSSSLQAVVLVFRGTEPWSIKNWISDIKFTTTSYPLCDSGKCKVQSDFYSSYQSINQHVIDKVAVYKHFTGYETLIVVGHSLGGALATHAVAHLIKAGHKVSLFETYGSPRVGNTDFENWFQRMYPNILKPRVTHGKDPIVHLPPKSFGFHHVQTEVFYEKTVDKGYVICNDSKEEDNKCSNQYLADLSVSDHLSYYGYDFSAIILACQ